MNQPEKQWKGSGSYSLKTKINVVIAIIFLLIIGLRTTYDTISKDNQIISTIEKSVINQTYSYFDGLNMLMLSGSMNEQETLRKKVLKTSGIVIARVLRAEVLKGQFGPGSADASPRDDLDRRALKGESISLIEQDKNGRLLTVITPMIATKNTRGTDCLSCHDVPSGTINGAVRLSYSLAETDSQMKYDMWISIGIGLILLLLGLWISNLVMNRIVITPIGRFNKHMKEIAEGDLTRRVDVNSQDEIGQLGLSINALANKLQGSIKAISGHAQTLAGASEEMTSVSQQMGANAEETSDQANVVSGASRQINENVQTVAAGIEELSASTGEIASNATEAAKVAAEAVNAAANANETISRLDTSSSEIGEIIKTITSIAQQTRLLALNATIEAARAGEAGKGFAVVANEVKDLAMETAKASDDINQKIVAIQADSKEAVDAIAWINEIITRINEFQNTIASAVEEQNATTSEIAKNVNDAANGTTEIAENIGGVAETAQSTSTGANDTQQASAELSRIATEMQQLVGKFRYE